MDMKRNPIIQPHPDLTFQSANRIINEFDFKKMVYLDSTGHWKENPRHLIQKAVNEILFYLWNLEEKQRSSLLNKIIEIFLKKDRWALVLKIRAALLKDSSATHLSLSIQNYEKDLRIHLKSSIRTENDYPFLILLQVLAWILKYKALHQNMDLFIPDWDLTEKKKIQKYKKRFLDSDKMLDNCLSRKKKQQLLLLYAEIKKLSPYGMGTISDLLAEEDKLSDDITEILKQANQPAQKEESYSLIIEKIFPDMGVVSETSPAFLRPCMQLLRNHTIDISSGIQYQASVILSILQDSRSTKNLLDALKIFPLHFTHIRENIIYTLGNLSEKDAITAIHKVLEGPDKIISSHTEDTKKPSLLEEQKEESIRSLGKIGLESLTILPTLIKYQHHPSFKIKTHLSWTLGEIGKIQKLKHGGVSVDILITLLTLLKIRNKQIFEEAVSALQKIDMPEFMHTLYLYDVGAVSILGLKPAQSGLYELSETLHYLIHSQGRVIMAVNGDSGTGKTYFCESILESFGDLKSKDILYLMRDRKKDQKIFNQILGIQWLKKHIDPIYYQDYPHSEKDDQPEEFLKKFLKDNSDKKLIIIDGCRDQYYFQRIIDLLHFNENLDVVVNFRANFSTRRKNLEEREVALESVKTHLSFLEDPPLEDTHFYREGKVIVYDLDNSINKRLNKQEIQELFKKRRIETWAHMIKVGDFTEKTDALIIKTEHLPLSKNRFDLEKLTFLRQKQWGFKPKEKRFNPIFNEKIEDDPYLLQTIPVDEPWPRRIRFYAQNQIAGIGEKGDIFMLTLLDNRIFYTPVEEFDNLSLLGRKIFLVNNKGGLLSVSFEEGQIVKYESLTSPIHSITSLPRNKLITGHKNGLIMIWDMEKNELLKFKAHSSPVTALSVDYFGHIYSWGSDHRLKYWNLKTGHVDQISTKNEMISCLKTYPQKRLMALWEKKPNKELKDDSHKQTLKIIHFHSQTSYNGSLPLLLNPSSIHICYDGKIFSALSSKEKNHTMVVLTPDTQTCKVHFLKGHTQVTRDCLCMGPKVISCGKEENENVCTFRIWGTEFYVRTQISKLSG